MLLIALNGVDFYQGSLTLVNLDRMKMGVSLRGITVRAKMHM